MLTCPFCSWDDAIYPPESGVLGSVASRQQGCLFVPTPTPFSCNDLPYGIMFVIAVMFVVVVVLPWMLAPPSSSRMSKSPDMSAGSPFSAVSLKHIRTTRVRIYSSIVLHIAMCLREPCLTLSVVSHGGARLGRDRIYWCGAVARVTGPVDDSCVRHKSHREGRWALQAR